jgi:hypothetical protein
MLSRADPAGERPRICILANSHAAMLKHARDAAPDLRWSPTFFAAPSGLMRSLRLTPDRKRLVTANMRTRDIMTMVSGGLHEVALGDFDAIVLMGLTAKSMDAMRLFTDYQPLGRRVSPDATLISEDAFEATIRSIYSQSIAQYMLKQLQAIDHPILFVPSPVPAETLALREGFGWISQPGGREAVAWINAMCFGIWQEAAIEAGARIALQPAQTLGALNLTKRGYSEGSMMLQRDQQQVDDDKHMNARYGRLVLEQIGDVFAPQLTAQRISPRPRPRAKTG